MFGSVNVRFVFYVLSFQLNLWQLLRYRLRENNYDVQRGKKAFIPYANSDEVLDERANPCNLTWTFSVCRHILQYLLI